MNRLMETGGGCRRGDGERRKEKSGRRIATVLDSIFTNE